MQDFLKYLGFTPKENTTNIYSKKYTSHAGHEIIVDFKNETIDYGTMIKSERDTTRNFSQEENWVVLECVNRLLEKGYRPEDITLEKKFTVGHGAAGGWLDVFVRKEGKAYIMIECKTWGKEFEKEWQNTQKKGGQLLSYLQQDRDAEFLVLYASQFEKGEVIYKNEIIKIEDDYRLMSNVEELYARWNKFSKQNGIFEPWTKSYHFESKALTIGDLKEIRQEDSSFIFNRFLEILRHNAVSDKPNAFNKIFTLFLCKIKDEDKQPTEELDFQWKEGEDDSVSFQKRLSDLYKKGMQDFLNKTISDISDKDFNGKYSHLSEGDRQSILHEITRIRLQKNNEFAIKEVFDEETFEENSKVLKEVVELLQGFRFRYTKKQPFLGDFFELLLTTGLKQEAGQFFTPVPIARFISKSVPMRSMLEKKLMAGNKDELLPNIIDYAAGSGHFLTESMEELQNILASLDLSQFPPSVQREVKPWQFDNPFAWAYNYIYGIELDYRLVKTTKVGCYLHGDGIANVIHGDGLDSFTNSNYVGKLQKTIPGTQDNGQFDFVLANPPYSVSACKGNLKNKSAQKDFTLYDSLTDQSSQIESLFIERTKQLLIEGGIAAIILPSSILSNTGIYTKTREILLKYFEFVAITELGSGTFMATGTNTVILFLRRRNNYDALHIAESVKNFFTHHKDNTIQGIETPIAKYIRYVWQSVSVDDYVSMISGSPSEAIKKHEIYIEYEKKIKAKNPKEWLEIVRTTEQEKILYFLLAYGQKLVLVKSGEKKVEENFLGYKFSDAKGKSGILPIRGGHSIDSCTMLFDSEKSDNEAKVNTYILDAFDRKYDREISSNLMPHIYRSDLVDMLTWDRVEFEKNIGTSIKKKIKMESKYDIVNLGSVCNIKIGGTPSRDHFEYYNSGNNLWVSISEMKWQVINDTKEKITDLGVEKSNVKLVKKGTTLLSFKLSIGKVAIAGKDLYTNEAIAALEPLDRDVLLDGYLFALFASRFIDLEKSTFNAFGKSLNSTFLKEEVKIPLPPLDIQEQIVREMEKIEKKEANMKDLIENGKQSIVELFHSNQCVSLKSLLLDINPSKSSIIQGFSDDADVAFLSMPDVSNEGIITNLQTRQLRDVKSGFTFFQENDVLLAKITPCMENGKGALVPKIVNNLGFGSTEFFVLRPDITKLKPKILFYFTQNSVFRIEAEKSMTGASGHRRVPKDFVENYLVPDISLSEQQKIVAEIEKIEVEIARIEAELASISAEKDAILKKYL